jgi:beta-glucosidase-like glycosyl hydrolase
VRIVNQVGSCENKDMISGVLKGELGFQGFVVSDWAAIDDEGNGGIGPWGSVEAGVDVTMPGKVFFCFAGVD